MKRLSWILTLPVTVGVVVFAVANRNQISISLWPSDASLEVPVFAVALGGFVVGFIVGAVIMWLSGSRTRNRARRLRYRAEELEREQNRLERQVQSAKARTAASASSDASSTQRLAIAGGKGQDSGSELRT